MESEHVLIVAKTYPTLSESYIELVCTAGLRADGSWVRIYPVPFRLLDGERKFSKWHWVDLPLRRRDKDSRPESYSPVDRNQIDVSAEKVGTSDDWRERRRLVLDQGRGWTGLTDLITAGKRDEVSLATFKPKNVRFEYSRAESREWDENKLARVKAQLEQSDLFEEDLIPENFRLARKLPYDFSYRFEDDSGRESKLKILDWEIGMLYWNSLNAAGRDEAIALEKVRQKYGEEFLDRDLYLFLGTTYEWHKRGPNPWVIIGVFPPPFRNQMDLAL